MGFSLGLGLGLPFRSGPILSREGLLSYIKEVDGNLVDTADELSKVVLSNWSIPVLARPLIPSYVLPVKSTGEATYTIGPGQTYETYADLVASVTLQPGDIIDGGGNTFTDTWLIDGFSGSLGNLIVFRNANIDVSAKTSGQCVVWSVGTNNVNYVQFEDMELTGNGGDAVFKPDGNAGTGGDGYTITCINVDILKNHGAGSGSHDGFSLTADSQLLLYNCSAAQCRPDPQSSGSHQAITAHTNCKVISIGCSFTDSNNLYIGTADTQAYFYDCDFEQCYSAMVGLASNGANGNLIVDNCRLTLVGTENLLQQDNALATAYIINSTITDRTTSGGTSFLRGNTEFYNNVFDLDGALRIYTFAATCTLYCHSNQFNISNVTKPLFRVEVAGSYLYFHDNNVVMDTAGDGLIIFNNAAGSVQGNIFDSFAGDYLVRIETNIDADVEVRRNIFYNCEQIMDNNLSGAELYNINLEYNVFQDCADVYTTLNNVIADYNCYYNSENAGGTNSITDDPLLTDPANGDFSIPESSPLLTANIAELGDLAMNIVSGTGVSDWVVSMPEHPELIAILSAFSTLYDSSNNAINVTWAQLDSAADDHYLFVGPKPGVATYKIDRSRDESKINKIIGN